MRSNPRYLSAAKKPDGYFAPALAYPVGTTAESTAESSAVADCRSTALICLLIASASLIGIANPLLPEFWDGNLVEAAVLTPMT